MKKEKETLHKVNIVGIGPGHPDLLTIQATQILEQTDVILYDCLANQCILEDQRFQAKIEFVEKDMTFQKMIDIMENYYLEGKKVARLRSGDSMMFNSGGIESKILKERKIPFDVIPGITAAGAASSVFSIPTTELNESDALVHFISHDTPENFAQIRDLTVLFKYGTTIALYMANQNLTRILNIMKEENVDQNLPVVVVSRVSMPEETAIYTHLSELLGTLETNQLRSPMVFFIGKHVKILNDKLNIIQNKN
ncbi:SAM-dependent methyltransferase [Apibacter raozihei]|uniref:uroporphyrinogen-III C-methyltransferase n=1 Tax=Apibacter raozihei TaxID=2500547 RepID=UPI000FE3BA5C|nr:SAM-dependent methyltransferase [Apibacter raozihei]